MIAWQPHIIQNTFFFLFANWFKITNTTKDALLFEAVVPHD